MAYTENTASAPRLIDSTSLRKVLLVSVFLLLGTFLAHRAAAQYLDRLALHDQIQSWNRAIHYLDTVAALFLVLEMLIVIILYWGGQGKLNFRSLYTLLRPSSSKPLLWGGLMGLTVYTAAFPLLWLFDKDVQFVRLVINDMLSVRTILLILLLGMIVPVITEIVFRGIIFSTLKKELGLVAALVTSSLLFAYVWPIFDSGTAFLLGLGTAFLYHRFQHLCPGIIASATVTILATLTLFGRLLFGARP
jgi:membrane protease YdiL (CAAX protease family)